MILMEIVGNNGRVYKDLRAYHIALGHAVRQALLDFYDEVKEYAISEVWKFYENEFYGSDYYENTFGMIDALENSDDINGAISYIIKGNWEKNVTFDISIDWSQLDGHSNGRGEWGTYTSFDGKDATGEWEQLLESGLPKGILEQTGERHPSFNLGEKIEKYVEKNLDNRIQDVLDNF